MDYCISLTSVNICFFVLSKRRSPRDPWRSSTQSSAPKIEDGGGFFVLRSSDPKNEDDPLPSSKSPSIFEEPPHLRSSGPEDRRSPIFDFRSRRTKNLPHLQSSIFDPEDRRTPPSSIFGPEEWVEDRTEVGGGRGFFEDGGGGFFKDGGIYDLTAPKNEEPPVYDLRGRKNEEPSPLPPSRPEDRGTPAPTFFSFRPRSLDQ